MVSRPFSAFEKESLEIAGRLSRRPGSRSRYEADPRQWHASEMRSHGRITSFLVRYSVRLQRRLNSDRKSFEIFGGLDLPRWEKGCFASPWVEPIRRLSPALWVSVLVVGKEAYARDAEDEQLTFLWRLVDTSDSATTTTSPRPGDASPRTTWTGCVFFACLSMTQDRTTTYRVTTCATATRLSLVVWHVWRFLVRYNNRGRRRLVDQNDRSFLSFFFHF